MRYLLLTLMFLIGCTDSSPAKYSYGDSVIVKGFYADCDITLRHWYPDERVYEVEVLCIDKNGNQKHFFSKAREIGI